MTSGQIFVGMEHLHLIFSSRGSVICKFQIIRILVCAFHAFHILSAGSSFAVRDLYGISQFGRNRVFCFNRCGIVLGRKRSYTHVVKHSCRHIQIHHVDSLLQIYGRCCFLPVFPCLKRNCLIYSVQSNRGISHINICLSLAVRLITQSNIVQAAFFYNYCIADTAAFRYGTSGESCHIAVS